MAERPYTLSDFVRESNMIEGICRDPTDAEIGATAALVSKTTLTISDLIAFVKVCQPNAVPRFVQGLDVRVGPHIAPRGGPNIQERLAMLLQEMDMGAYTPYESHCLYETLHPFTDGNGRSGRALWLRAMAGISEAPLGFLHHFYYQALQGARNAKRT